MLLTERHRGCRRSYNSLLSQEFRKRTQHDET